jgi:hypothetical protein
MARTKTVEEEEEEEFKRKSDLKAVLDLENNTMNHTSPTIIKPMLHNNIDNHGSSNNKNRPVLGPLNSEQALAHGTSPQQPPPRSSSKNPTLFGPSKYRKQVNIKVLIVLQS